MNRRALSVAWIRILSSAVGLTAVSVSCSDEPNPVGIGLLPPIDLVSIDTVVTREATSVTFKQFISPNDRSLLVGTYSGYEARSLIRFPSLPDTLGDALVDSAALRMDPFYGFGDTAAPLTFTIHKILKPWSETTATWDSVNADFYDDVQRGSFSDVVSDTTVLKVTLDPALAQDWLKAAADSTDQFGMILLPASGLSVIKGFASFQSTLPAFRPTLVIVYEQSGRRDTLTSNVGSDLFVANVDLDQKPELMYIQAGVSYRSRLRFALSAIPANAIVHNATLELTINRSESEPQQRGADSLLFVYHVSDSSTNEFETPGERGFGVDGNPDAVAVNLTKSVQRWVLGESNQGIILGSFDEEAVLDRIAFFSPLASDSSKRPRLKVTYSRSPG